MNIDFGIPMNEEVKPNNNQSNNYYQEQQQPVQEQKNLGTFGFLSVAYYQPYFNVTQQEVYRRLIQSMIPVRTDFLELIKSNPDLWGPFWISTTLILLIAVAGNIAIWLGKGQYVYDFIPVAATLLYSVTFGMPLILTILMKCYSCEISLFSTICLYGYSMMPLIPITILCTIPIGFWKWILILYGLINSCFFLIKNLESELNKLEQQKRLLVQGVIIVIQLTLYLMYKFYFFGVIISN